MKKTIAIILSIQLIFVHSLPSAAQGIRTAAQKGVPAALSATVAERYTQQFIKGTAVSSVAGWGSNAAANTPKWQYPVGKEGADLSVSVTRAVNREELLTLLDQHKQLLKDPSFNDFSKSTSVLKKQIDEQAAVLLRQSASNLTAGQLAVPANKPVLESVTNLINGISLLGLCGTAKTDAPLLLNIYKKTADTPISPLITTTVVRALLKMKAYKEVVEVADLTKDQSLLWQGINQFLTERKLDLRLPKPAGNTHGLVYAAVLYPFGKLTVNAANPSKQATAWYMNLDLSALSKGRPQPPAAPKQTTATGNVKQPRATARTTVQQNARKPVRTVPQRSARQSARTPAKPAQKPVKPKVATNIPTPKPAVRTAPNSGINVPPPPSVPPVPAQAGGGNTPKKDATFFQKLSLNATAFVIGLEVGPPIMASLGDALNLSLEENILIPVATYFPYSVGTFFSDWLKEKIGRRAAMNTGLILMGSSFLAGATFLGLNGNFVPWANSTAHFWSILGALTTASLGGVFIHSSVGPAMTEISPNVTDFVRQQRGAFIELSRSAGMLSSYAFPFLATSVLGLDWSAPFLMAIPFVAVAAAGLNFSGIPNTRPVSVKPETPSEVSGSLKKKFNNNAYVRLFRNDRSTPPFLGALFLMNAVETAYNGGYLLLLPSLVENAASQYLLGLTQFAVPFVMGRFLASGFLRWFPNRNLSIATSIGAIGGLAAWGFVNNVSLLTLALFISELGISTSFTLSFARTARNPGTQDRLTSLIVASSISCSIGPFLFTSIAQSLVNAGLIASSQATSVALIAIPAVLAFFSTGLFNRVERLTSNLNRQANGRWNSFRNFFRQSGNTAEKP